MFGIERSIIVKKTIRALPNDLDQIAG